MAPAVGVHDAGGTDNRSMVAKSVARRPDRRTWRDVDRWWRLPFVELLAGRRGAAAGQPVRLRAVVPALVRVPAAPRSVVPLPGRE